MKWREFRRKHPVEMVEREKLKRWWWRVGLSTGGSVYYTEHRSLMPPSLKRVLIALREHARTADAMEGFGEFETRRKHSDYDEVAAGWRDALDAWRLLRGLLGDRGANDLMWRVDP